MRKLEEHQKHLQSLRDKLSLYANKHGLHICTYGRDGFSMYIRTVFVASEGERDKLIGTLCKMGFGQEHSQGKKELPVRLL